MRKKAEVEIMREEDKKRVIVTCLLIACLTIHFLTYDWTVYVVGQGGVELNPVVNSLFLNFGFGGYLLVSSVFISVYYLLLFVWASDFSRDFRVSYWVLAFLFFAMKIFDFLWDFVQILSCVWLL